MAKTLSGFARKMRTQLESPVSYQLPLDDVLLPMNSMIGKTVQLRFTGRIACIHCARKIKKTYNQGYCFPCLRKLAQCDQCIVRPELCHFHLGTCREPTWAQDHCLKPHIVYLAISSGLKVGITRSTQVPTRWIDQGARVAAALFRVQSRRDSGLLEVACKQRVADRTDWRAMLRGDHCDADIEGSHAAMQTWLMETQADLQLEGAIEAVDFDPLVIDYPNNQQAFKLKSWDLLKQPCLTSQLVGIKGQYLMFEDGVINIRKHAGFEIEVDCG